MFSLIRTGALGALVLASLHPQLAHAVGNPNPAEPAPKLVEWLPGRTFIPPGFDSNDRTQLVVAGDYPNTCYKSGPTSVKVDREAKKITLTHRAYYYSDSMCLQVLVPFVETVNIGILEPGNYEVVKVGTHGKEFVAGNLPVAQALSPAADDSLYAMVDHASIERNGMLDEWTLVLGGYLPGTCSKLQEVRVLNRVPNILEVLPIVVLSEQEPCGKEPVAFETRVSIPTPGAGLSLIHIRSLNGTAFNRVVQF